MLSVPLLLTLIAVAYSSSCGDIPFCSRSRSRSGWDRENGRLCIVAGSSAARRRCPNSLVAPRLNVEAATTVSALCGGYPICTSSSQDPDGDGWGWTGSQSCLVSGSQPQRDRCVIASSSNNDALCGGYPLCSSASQDPDGDGWGWTGSQSCLVIGSQPQTQRCTVASTGGGGGGGGGSAGGSCPSNLQCPNGMRCGCYAVPGLGQRKQEVTGAFDGGDSLAFLASAMMETETMRARSYPWGDGKRDDAFNAGLAKQNWFLSRQCYAPWRSMGPQDFGAMDVMNDDLKLDRQVYDLCSKKFGVRRFLAAHRNGETGFNQPDTPDINRFIEGFEWTKQQLVGHEKDDLRFWLDIPAI